jgi:hypothetical protein
MQVGAVVIPYRQVTAGVVSSVPGSGSLRNLPSAWTQPLNGPIGDPARKRTFRLREKLAGILSKDSRHVLLPSPHDRYGVPANTTQRAAVNSRKSIISTPIQDRPL